MPILIILYISDLLLYAVIPVTIVFIKLKYTGKSTLLQMWGHFILSNCAAGILDQPLDHAEVVETAAKVKHTFVEVLDLALTEVL